MAQEKYLDELDDATREFSGSDSIDPNDYREVRDAIRQLKQTWKGYSKEVENKSEAKKILWLKIIKRLFVITGTFLVLTGIIWGILIYLLF